MKRVVFLGGVLLLLAVILSACSRMTPVLPRPRVPEYKLKRMEVWRLQREETLAGVRQTQEELDQEVEQEEVKEVKDEREDERTGSSQEQLETDPDVKPPYSMKERMEERRAEMEKVLGFDIFAEPPVVNVAPGDTGDTEAEANEEASESEPPAAIRPRPGDKPDSGSDEQPEKEEVSDIPEFFAPIEEFGYDDPKNSEEFSGVREDKDYWYAWGWGKVESDKEEDLPVARRKAEHMAEIILDEAVSFVVRRSLFKENPNYNFQAAEEKTQGLLRGSQVVNEVRKRYKMIDESERTGWRIAILMAVPKQRISTN